MKILKKGVAIILCAAAIFTALPYGTFAADDAGDLKIGDYICLGKYYGLPIIWRYAADDEHGKFILSDKIISKKPFHTSLKIQSCTEMEVNRIIQTVIGNTVI